MELGEDGKIGNQNGWQKFKIIIGTKWPFMAIKQKGKLK
jgi:hypothetical protein